MRVNSTLYFVLKDHLGSASVMTDSTGTIVGEDRFYPFGETRFTTGTMFTDKLFTGQREMAGLGIYHYGARFYSPKLGRFLSADSIVPGAGNPQAFNRYSYVLNNPLRYVDPSGHNPCRSDYLCKRRAEKLRAKEATVRHGVPGQLAQPVAQQSCFSCMYGGGGSNFWSGEYGTVGGVTGSGSYGMGSSESAEDILKKHRGSGTTWSELTPAEQATLRNTIQCGPACFTEDQFGGSSQADALHDPLTYIEILVLGGGFFRAAIRFIGPIVIGGAPAGPDLTGDKLTHIFGNPTHNLQPLLQSFNGNAPNAFAAVSQQFSSVAGQYSASQLANGIEVVVNNIPVVVRGAIVDGVARIGTFFIP